MLIIDALGKACPLPVVLAKKQAEQDEKNAFQILVDNEEAVSNLEKLADSLPFSVKTEQKDKTYSLTFLPDSNKVLELAQKNSNKTDHSAYVVVFSSDKMGEGDDVFSQNLLKNFIFALTENKQLPKAIICYNKGVNITTTDDENLLSDLNALAQMGVQILSCGLCLEQYQLKDKLKIGEITNMYNICLLLTENHVVKP